MPRLLLLPLLLLVGCSTSREDRPEPADHDFARMVARDDETTLVAANRGNEIPPGFRGEVHPSLRGQKELEVTAIWSPIPKGMGYEMGYFPERFYQPFESVSVAETRRKYGAREWSGFLPEQFEAAGQMWTLDEERIATFLQQFDNSVSLQLGAPGRRAGPNGAFAVLRAMSPDYADIEFRVHAEFNLAAGVYCTPAYFTGRVLINRDFGTVEHFELKLPNDRALNTTLTVLLSTEALIDIVSVEQMELRAGNDAPEDAIVWTDSISDSVARDLLRGAFYKFAEIDWVPVDEAPAAAQASGKPIMAIVLWGALDDQSC